jgi:hypothetical protein
MRDRPGPEWFCYAGELKTCVLGVSGQDTAFDSDSFPNWLMLDKNLVVLVETATSDLHWMQPGDLDVTIIPETATTLLQAGISSNTEQGVHIAFADGEVWRISTSTPMSELRKFLTNSSATHNDRDEVLARYRVASEAPKTLR